MDVPMRVKPFLSLRYKLLIPLMSLAALMFTMGYFGAQTYLKDTIFSIMDEEAESIETYVKECLDVDALQSFTESAAPYDEANGIPEAMQDPQYLKLQDCVASVAQFNSRAWVYTYYKVDENTLAFGVDMWNTTEPENGSPLGYTFTYADGDFEEHLLGLEYLNAYDDLVYDEELGVYYYATTSPLVNSNGEHVGGLAVYLDAGWTVEQLQNLSENLLVIFICVFALVAVFILTITRRAMSQLETLQKASRRVADGDYTLIPVKIQRIDDEISMLTDLFNTMLDKVEEREEDLEQQVEQLKLQIDNEKRQKDVKEIVESEFFQDLKNRAATVRKQREQKS